MTPSSEVSTSDPDPRDGPSSSTSYFGSHLLLLAHITYKTVRGARHGNNRRARHRAARRFIAGVRRNAKTDNPLNAGAPFPRREDAPDPGNIARVSTQRRCSDVRIQRVGWQEIQKTVLRSPAMDRHAGGNDIATTVQIGPEDIPFTVDDSPLKQNKFTPARTFRSSPKPFRMNRGRRTSRSSRTKYFDDINR